MKQGKLYFKNLDSIRFIAAFMVFLSHALKRAYPLLGIDDSFLFRFLNAVSNGGTGVSIFFVLSGFLITYLIISEYEVSGTISVRNFYIRRILRIWPLYFAIVIFTFYIYGFIRHSTAGPANIWYYVTFLSNFDVLYLREHKFDFSISQDVTWSVSLEEQFYLFWPLLFAFLPKRTWLYAILLIIVGSVAFRVLHTGNKEILYFHTFSVLVDLGTGAFIACLIKYYSPIRQLFESVSTPGHILLFAVALSLMIWGDLIFSFPYADAISRVFTAVSFGLIIAAQAMTQKDSILNLGKFSIGNTWGKYTYGIYLIHPIAINFVDMAKNRAHVVRADFPAILLSAIAAFLLTLLLSWLSYEYFESKFLALKHKFEVIKTAR